MSLKATQKIVIVKNAKEGAAKRPAPVRRRAPINLQPAEKPSVWWIWVLIILVVVIFGGVLAHNSARTEKRPAAAQRYAAPVQASPPQENLWMGKWMKEHGTPEELRARQERVRQHESGRDGT